MNNRLEPTELDDKLADGKPAHKLADATNVTLNDKGYLKRREGTTPVLGGRCHSLWSDPHGGFVVRNSDLCIVRVDDAGVMQTDRVRNDVGGARISYSRGADGDVYWTNGSVLRRVSYGQDRPVITAPPERVPDVTVGSGGLTAGTYLVATTLNSSDGESPATPVVAVTVPDGSSLIVSSTEYVNVYVSAPNGDWLTLQGAGANYEVVVWNDAGRRCETINRATMPAGQIVRHYRGSLLVAAGRILFVSDPYNYGVVNMAKGWFPLPSTLTLVEPTDNGVYIGTEDAVYWINDLFNDALQDVLTYGALPFTSARSTTDTKVFWMTNRGLIQADENMSVKNLQEANLDFGDATSGATLYRERDGATHVVASRANVQQATAAVSSWMEAEVIRKGTVL